MPSATPPSQHAPSSTNPAPPATPRAQSTPQQAEPQAQQSQQPQPQSQQPEQNQPHQQSPSPSPPPSAPLPSTPGPRAQALHQITTSALTATLAKVSPANFSACFPTMATYAARNLDGLHRDFVGRLEESFTTNFERVCEKRGVVRGLNGLDGVLAGARGRRDKAEKLGKENGGGKEVHEAPQSTHTLRPEELYAAHLHPFLATHAAELESELRGCQAANKELCEKVVAQRREIAELVKGLEDVVRELERTAGVVGGEEVGALEGEMRGVMEAMRGSG